MHRMSVKATGEDGPSASSSRAAWVAAFIVFTVSTCSGLSLCGCGAAVQPPLADHTAHETTRPPAVEATTESTKDAPSPSVASAKLEKEYWDAFYFGSDKVGYAHTVFERVDEGAEQVRRISTDTELSLRRFGQNATQRMSYTSIEKLSGEPVRFESKMSSGPTQAGDLITVGRVENNEVKIEIMMAGRKTNASIPWNSSWGGFFAIDQTLERQPMKVGETRNISALVPGFNQVAEIDYSATGMESTKLLDGPRELLRIEVKTKLGKNTLEQVTWVDDSGQSLKSFIPALDQTSYRTTKEIATGKNTGNFDLGERTIVKVQGKIERPHELRRATYRVRLKNADPADSFAVGATQTFERVDDRTFELRIRSLTRGAKEEDGFPRDEPPTADDLAPNSLVQSDNAEVIALAESVAAGSSDKRQVAIELEKLVRRHVSNKSFAQALSSAAEVVRSREGDCTEHAVLLAALCRARQIPARVVIGLVYFQPANGFAYHMWTEVWDGNYWIPLDGTLGLGGIGAGHIKVSDSNLKGVDPLTQFLPVLQLLGNLQIEVVSLE